MDLQLGLCEDSVNEWRSVIQIVDQKRFVAPNGYQTVLREVESYKTNYLKLQISCKKHAFTNEFTKDSTSYVFKEPIDLLTMWPTL